MANSGERSKTSVMAPTPFPNALSTAIANNPRRFVATIAILTYLILATLTYRTVGDDKSAVPFVWFLVIPSTVAFLAGGVIVAVVRTKDSPPRTRWLAAASVPAGFALGCFVCSIFIEDEIMLFVMWFLLVPAGLAMFGIMGSLIFAMADDQGLL